MRSFLHSEASDLAAFAAVALFLGAILGVIGLTNTPDDKENAADIVALADRLHEWSIKTKVQQ